MAQDERAELEALSHEELLECYDGALFEHVTEGVELPELAQMCVALGIKDFIDSCLSERTKDELIELFLDGDRAVVEMVDHAAKKGLLEE